MIPAGDTGDGLNNGGYVSLAGEHETRWSDQWWYMIHELAVQIANEFAFTKARASKLVDF